MTPIEITSIFSIIPIEFWAQRRAFSLEGGVPHPRRIPNIVKVAYSHMLVLHYSVVTSRTANRCGRKDGMRLPNSVLIRQFSEQRPVELES
jgi:hypothetical protein